MSLCACTLKTSKPVDRLCQQIRWRRLHLSGSKLFTSKHTQASIPGDHMTPPPRSKVPGLINTPEAQSSRPRQHANGRKCLSPIPAGNPSASFTSSQPSVRARQRSFLPRGCFYVLPGLKQNTATHGPSATEHFLTLALRRKKQG